MIAARIAIVITLASTGCLRDVTFPCTTDSDCQRSNAAGACEMVGYCSFPDSGCSGGRRFGELSGDRTGSCVGDEHTDGGVDGHNDGNVDSNTDAPDAPPTMCLGTYTSIGVGTHRYKLDTSGRNWSTQRDLCAADGAYLVIPDDQLELDAVSALSPANRVWTGISDLTTEGTYDTVKGGIQTFLPWDTGEPSGATDDCVEIQPQVMKLTDHVCANSERAVCECEP